jgi:thiol-disulfide isomerase/thioredoxin
MRVNPYLLVFGVIGVILVAAAVSTLFSFGNPSTTNQNLPSLGPAPNFKGIAAWINSQPLSISDLKGKVVLVDFWTYSCINCIRTIPYLNAWYDRYGNNGLVVVGVHTPEFQFEKNYSSVLSAVKSFGIKYPVALDSNALTWNTYGNQYWPEHYLIDKNGEIRNMHIGEGGYNSTESSIRVLLQDAGFSVGQGTAATSVNGTGVDFSKIGTPELYVGYDTARSSIGNPQGFSPTQTVHYTISGPMRNNTVYFSGYWYNSPDSMLAQGTNSSVFLIYDAKSVNIVASGNFSVITVGLNGRNLTQAYLGSDVTLHQGVASASINGARLYNIVAGPSYGWHQLEITASPGFRLYTFTFG